MKKSSNSYDVIIIGAGISGLVCGCYLAKAGIKVLIAEQHYKPGGYCSSFKRQGFTFDAAAHSFGSYRDNGNMKLVIKALELDNKIKIKRYSPSDIIISPDYKIIFHKDIDKTIQELQHAFPIEENNIRNFFQYLTTSNPLNFIPLRKMTFQNLLDHYFQNNKLKVMLSLPIFGNGALPPSLISAFTGSKIFREFILDGGYYPNGCMQILPNTLAERFKKLGGDLRLSCPVKKIKIKNNEIIGVVLENNDFISSKYVVSNCDVRQTFLKLLGKKFVKINIIKKIEKMIPSLSTFILYLGIDKPFKSLPKPGTNIWYLPYYDLEKAYYFTKKGDIDRAKGFMVRFSPDRKTILAFVNAPFKNKKYWDNNKDRLKESLLYRIEKYVIKDLSKHIIYKEAATPYTLHKYTYNYKGAAYGWASLPSQLFCTEFRQTTSIKGLYLTGHWTSQTQGIPGVAYLGLNLARLLLRRKNLLL